MISNNPIWQPGSYNLNPSNLSKFTQMIEEKYQQKFTNKYFDLYEWSIKNPQFFWKEVWYFTNIIGEIKNDKIIESNKLFYKTKFFPGAKLNYAENLLNNDSKQSAIIYYNENQNRRSLSYQELRKQTAKFAEFLKQSGIQKGDCVAAIMPNIPETIIAMLATASIGAVWSVCSPEFGIQGILDRLQQISPKFLFASTSYRVKNKIFNISEKIDEVLKQLPKVEQTVVYSHCDIPYSGKMTINDWQSLLNDIQAKELSFERVAFDFPLFIMFSSGTTGLPKCIVHGHGGSLIQHLKEHQLHFNINQNSKVFYFTTSGWMMWNWLVTALASNATIILYEGSPMYPDHNILFDLIEKEKITFFGVSAKYIDALRNCEAQPKITHNLSSIETIASTGSPLIPENFDYVYQHINHNGILASMAGGTDILSCFALGCSDMPVYRGELQVPGLGMAIKAYDKNGNSITQQKGELVCETPFPSMPVKFWNDENCEKYHDTYFANYNNIWFHGDFIEVTQNCGLIIHGRSDTVLNPGGVRIGTAEIYRQVDILSEISESVAIEQEFQKDTRIILFVKMYQDNKLTAELVTKIKKSIRQNASPWHVPAIILQVSDIPKTVSGKLIEKAVNAIVNGKNIKNKESIANPESLEYFKDRIELTL